MDDVAELTAPMEGVRVLEIGALAAGAYCGKLFADFGADVIKLEPVAGDPLRRAPPLLDAGSALFAWLNAGKRSAEHAGDPVQSSSLDALLSGADLLIDSSSACSAETRHAQYRARFPRLSIISLSWFGETGPYSDFVGSDSVCRALAGLTKLAGPVEGPPIFLPDYQASVFAGLSAFTAATAALYSGLGGRRYEISVFESLLPFAEFQTALPNHLGLPERRQGLNRFHPNLTGIYACREGWFGFVAAGPRHWKGLCEMLGLADWLQDPELDTRQNKLRRWGEIETRVSERLRGRTAREWFGLAMARRIPMVMVPTMADLLAEPVHRDAGAFETIELGAARFEAPKTPLGLKRTPPRARGPAPLSPVKDVDWRASGLGSSRGGPTLRGSGEPTRPLHGLRVLDLTMGWAGPLASRQLADLGASVFKIEACAFPDWFRNELHPDPRERAYERNPWFAALNRGKFGAAVDVYQPGGVEVIKQLIAKVDVLMENYSSDVMPKLGLDYEQVRQINPSLVMLSMPAFSAQGPWRSVRALGFTMEEASGLPTVAGPIDGPPAMIHVAYGDPNGGLNGAAAVTAALLHRRRTGEGQHVELAQVQALFPLAAPWIIEQSVTGAVKRPGSRHPSHVPSGVFRCAGDDAWIVVDLTADTAWPRLCEVLGRDDLSADPAFRTAAGRRAIEDEIEIVLSRWAAQRNPETAMRELQAAGAAAGVARAPSELLADPHLAARRSWQVIDRAWSGPQKILSAPFREEGAPYVIGRPAPTLGQDNEYVLCECLGLPASDLEALIESGVSGAAAPD